MAEFIHTALNYGMMAVLTVVVIGYAYYSKLYGYFKRKGYPYHPATFPFGNLLPVFTLRTSYGSFLADLYSKYKGEEFVGFFQFGKKSVLVLDRELLKNVLVKDFDHFDQKSIYYDKEREPLSGHLFAVAGDEWRILRKKMLPAYSTGRIRDMFGTVTDVCRELSRFVANKCAETDEIECRNLFMRYGLRMIASTAFGLDTDVFNDQNSAFVRNAALIGTPTPLNLIRGSLVFFGRDVARALKLHAFPKESHKFFYNTLINMVQFREKTKTSRNDFLQLMIGMKDGSDGDRGLTFDEIAAQSFIFILAGFETISNTMGFILYELALSNDIQQKVLDEIDSVDDTTYQSLNSMEYLDMVMDESLRKHSSLAFVSRECSRDYVTPGGRLIEKGTDVVVSMRGLHFDPELFSDPHLFDPERFSKERKKDIKPFSYLPFGEGPRQCIGMRFGRLAVKAGLATLLREYRVERCSRTPHPLRYDAKSIATSAVGGLWLRFVPRKKTASS